jgi:hypothetical protein
MGTGKWKSYFNISTFYLVFYCVVQDQSCQHEIMATNISGASNADGTIGYKLKIKPHQREEETEKSINICFRMRLFSSTLSS